MRLVPYMLRDLRAGHPLQGGDGLSAGAHAGARRGRLPARAAPRAPPRASPSPPITSASSLPCSTSAARIARRCPWSGRPCKGWENRRSDHHAVHGHRPPRGLWQRPVAAGRLEPADHDLSRSRLVQGRPVGGGAERGLPPRGRADRLSLRGIPRDAFDYLWLVDMPPIPRAWVAEWTPVWIGEGLDAAQAVDAPLPADEEPRPKIRRTESAIGR